MKEWSTSEMVKSSSILDRATLSEGCDNCYEEATIRYRFAKG